MIYQTAEYFLKLTWKIFQKYRIILKNIKIKMIKYNIIFYFINKK
jgi:hypothetical protein